MKCVVAHDHDGVGAGRDVSRRERHGADMLDLHNDDQQHDLALGGLVRRER